MPLRRGGEEPAEEKAPDADALEDPPVNDDAARAVDESTDVAPTDDKLPEGDGEIAKGRPRS